MARGGATEQAAKTTFRDVFAVAEFRALWGAQLLSVIGDQLARVALTVLVYDRTRSALLAAITFVASIVPTFVGGVTLAWLADRYPRRAVMIACDLARCALVLVMAIPGVPLAGLVALLFLVTLVGAPFTSARAARNWSAGVSPRKTWPTSNKAISAKPRSAFLCAAATRPGMRLGRMSDRSAAIGLASASSGLPPPNKSACFFSMNDQVTASTRLRAPSARLALRVRS